MLPVFCMETSKRTTSPGCAGPADNPVTYVTLPMADSSSRRGEGGRSPRRDRRLSTHGDADDQRCQPHAGQNPDVCGERDVSFPLYLRSTAPIRLSLSVK